MMITVITENRAGILSRIARALRQADLKVERQSRSESETANQVTYTFQTEDDARPAAPLDEVLRQIPYVLAVSVEATQEASVVPAETAATYALEPYIDDLVRAYPNLISGVRHAQQTLSLDEGGWYELGEGVGKELVATGAVKPIKTDSLTFALERLVLPTMKSFAFAKVVRETLSVSVNPFTQGVSSRTPNCHFLTGLIRGLLKTAIPAVTVREVACKATGEAACTFVASLS